MVAYLRVDPHNNDSDIWIYDLRRNSDSRVTYRPMWYAPPVWSPKSDQLAYTGNRTGDWSIFVHDINSDKERQLPKSANTATYTVPTSWSSDGRYIAYQNSDPKGAWDLWIVPLGGGQASPFLATEFSETDGQFSPDGRWITFPTRAARPMSTFVRFLDRAPKSGFLTRAAHGQNGGRMAKNCSTSIARTRLCPWT